MTELFDDTTIAALIDPLTELVIDAGNAILAWDQKRITAKAKIDGSPVTGADFASDDVIISGLRKIAPDIPIVSEERQPPFATPFGGDFFLVDPLDGTKEYVAGHSDYAVCVALVVAGQPVLGVVGAPAIKTIWRGHLGHGAERLQYGGTIPERVPIATRPWPVDTWIAVISRSHQDAQTAAFIAKRPGAVSREMGSALKFCRIAEGAADIYPRLSPTSEWDLAAGCAVVLAAGGKVTDAHGGRLCFGQNAGGFVVPEFIAWGDPSQADC